ncbi:hypothetical protein DPMN_129066 [Dreissena polymorpha]|uniref:Uncharacterized protein n=1 Tax=Dreissena polymorpha TaxID=45954 RepID=A0A9D4K072_DREPO|nr:hypothetical protein DPMN_129066 [Dreissena polymorpha]
MLKLAQTNQPTDQPTDREKNNMSPTTIHIKKTVMSTGSHVSLQTGTTIIRINILTKIYGDMAKNVTSREFTRKTAQALLHTVIYEDAMHASPTAQLLGGPGLVMGPCIVDRIVIREVQYQLEVNRCRNEEIIVKGNFGWAWPMWEGHPRIDRIVIRGTDRHRAQTMTNDSALASVRICSIFDLIQDIIGTNVRTKFHDDQTINVALEKNAEPTGSHVFQPISIMFELVQDIIGMNLLTIFS